MLSSRDGPPTTSPRRPFLFHERTHAGKPKNRSTGCVGGLVCRWWVGERVFPTHPLARAVAFFFSVYYYHFRGGSHRVSAPAEATVWHTSRRPPPPLGGSIITTITTTTTAATTTTTTITTTTEYRHYYNHDRSLGRVWRVVVCVSVPIERVCWRPSCVRVSV